MSDSRRNHTLPASVNPATVVRGDFGPHDHPILGSPDRAPEWLGFHVSEYGEGYARAHMRVRADMLNGFSIAHGGMIFAFADTCFAWACNNPDGDGSLVTVTQGVDVNFLSSATEGTQLTAVGVRHSSTGRSGLCDVTVTDDHDRVVLEFRGRYRTVQRR